jgi:hypothetical protein
MGYQVKIQKIQRATNKTYYVNFPSAFADAIGLRKGEHMEWFIEDRNCFVLRRVRATASLLANSKNPKGGTDKNEQAEPRKRKNATAK